MPDSPLHPPSRPKSRSNPQVDSLLEALGGLKQDRCTWAATALLELLPPWPGAVNTLSRHLKRPVPRLSGMGITVRLTHIGGRSDITLCRDTPSNVPRIEKKMCPPISTISTISTARPAHSSVPAGGLTLGCSAGQARVGLMFSLVIAPMMMFGCAYRLDTPGKRGKMLEAEFNQVADWRGI